MVKLLTIVVATLLVASCAANPARLNRLVRGRNRFLARQEFAEEIPAQTAYPPAGDKPDVAFDLPTDESTDFGDQVDIVAPDQTYGPPETEDDPVEDFGVESERLIALRKNKQFAQQSTSKSAPFRKAAPAAAVVAAPVSQVAEPAVLPVSAQLQLLQPQQPQLLAQPILLADGRLVYSILA